MVAVTEVVMEKAEGLAASAVVLVQPTAEKGEVEVLPASEVIWEEEVLAEVEALEVDAEMEVEEAWPSDAGGLRQPPKGA